MSHKVSDNETPASLGFDETVHRFVVKAADAGFVGAVDGGKLLEWIDKVAYAAAARWSKHYCVTAYRTSSPRRAATPGPE